MAANKPWIDILDCCAQTATTKSNVKLLEAFAPQKSRIELVPEYTRNTWSACPLDSAKPPTDESMIL